jgi:hypothetical protein
MIILIAFILACWGLTQIICFGSIFNKIRPDQHFWKCPMCVGFHAGWYVFLFMQLPQLTLWVVMDALLYACISSGTSYALCMIFGDEGVNLKKN